MKLHRSFQSSRPTRAFTMIEIAIAMGVIGFALVAIIGILPRGMNAQKDNREDTIIAQDAPYFINCIRNGEQRTNGILTNYVESITNYSSTGTVGYGNSFLAATGDHPWLTNDYPIVGLLSTPTYDYRDVSGRISNHIVATVRAMTGSATTQNGANSIVAFRYQMTVDTTPWSSISYYDTNYLDFPLNSVEYITRSNRFQEAQYLTNSMSELRLTFAWPVLPNGNVGPGRATYRSLISSELTYIPNTPYWFFRSQYFSTNAPNSL